MTPEMFDEVLERLTPILTKQQTNWKDPLTPELKLALTLRHLATGESYMSLRFNFRAADNTISKVVREVCKAIVEEYGPEVVKTPTTPEEWMLVADQFERRWNIPHTIGSLDGKHVAIKRPTCSGSVYFNYKGFYSVVLMALVDAVCKFFWFDVGAPGHMSDAQIFGNSELLASIEDGTLSLLPATPVLPGR